MFLRHHICVLLAFFNCAYLSLLSPQAPQLRLTLCLSECADTRQFLDKQVFPYHHVPEAKKTFSKC